MEKTRAIVLNTFRYGEDKIIVHLLTEVRGMVSFIVKQPKGRRLGMRGALWQVFNILEVEYDHRSQRDLQQVREASLIQPWLTIPYDPIKTTLSLFLGEFLYQALKSEGENASLWEYLLVSLQWLDESDRGLGNFHLVVLMQMTRFLGFFPYIETYERGCCFDMVDGVFSFIKPEHGQFLDSQETMIMPLLLKMNHLQMRRVRMTRAERWRVLEIITKYYQLHIPGFGTLKSLDVLKEVFS